MKEKPSVVKKLMKPHKNILKLTIERPSKQEERTYMGQPPPAKDVVGRAGTINILEISRLKVVMVCSVRLRLCQNAINRLHSFWNENISC